MITKTFAVVDLETTGHSSAKGDRIIQIAIVFIRNGEIAEKFVRFVNPGQKIPPFIRQLTNITDEEVENAPYFEEIAEEVRNLLDETIFVAHNTDFDLSFLQNEFKRCGVEEWSGRKIDTVELSKIIFPSSASYRLQDIAEELDISLPAAHRADDDAEATSELLLACQRKLQTLPSATIELLHKKSFRLKTDLAALFYDALKEARKKSLPSEFSTFRGIPYRNIDDINKVEISHFDYPFDDNKKVEFLKATFPKFERRESQLRFMDTVWTALSEKSEIATEVPTGIGKSIAYLVPAAIQSMETGKPVVISTYTNYLADKIVNEEMKKLDIIFGANLKATVLKGREQYISLGKFEELLTISEQSYDETFTIMQILVWLTETKTGDLEDLNVSGGGQLFVDRIRKRSERMAPDEYQADFHRRLVSECSSSNFIITNHSMLLADSNRSNRIFNSLSGLIVDEVHQMGQIAIRHNEIVFSYTNWKYIMGQVGSEAEGQLLHGIFSLIDRFGLASRHVKEGLLDSFARFAEAFDEATAILSNYEPNAIKKQQGNRKVYPLDGMKNMKRYFSRVTLAISDYIDQAEAFIARLANCKNNMSRSELAYLSEWTYWIREIKIKAGDWVDIFFEEDYDNFTVWLEKDVRSIPGSLLIVKSPLESAVPVRKLIKRLKEDETGIIWTSGTMSIPNYDRYIPEKLGINDEVPLINFEAPSDFYGGAEVFIVEDMPEIQRVSQTDYIEAVTDAVIRTVMATGGRLFVLFTSQDMLRKTYDLITESEQLEEYALFAQGITPGSRMKLLKSFNQYQRSVLFGTSSFWEGVDVPGDALSAVIVVRLPFTSPEDPVFKARAAILSGQGLNPFVNYALPEAVMRLRQGFGRLIRSSSDKGFFIILDRRIDTKSYGKQFLASLPEVPVKKVPLQVMVNELENCYNRLV
ncbi:ATP-dependent DNA helicase DinG [Sporosarcina jiandibaonis]|uniref:ATP-dependent DNA helicase DinG n=1 Tax=Sporosarcina jiandibaonis TaxID=2715535 RepID=UPI001552B8F2|nr:ATP-dependent DNA helicase DinG [Sporosarcina jiandibaonis]